MKALSVLILCIAITLSFVSCASPVGTTDDVTETVLPAEPIFNTENIQRITFYAYYGHGKGSEVPADHLAEITEWLGTFVIDKKADDFPPPGTNTYHVEIEYMDGTIVKKGLDLVVVDGTPYYVKHAARPDCFMDIISKTSLE